MFFTNLFSALMVKVLVTSLAVLFFFISALNRQIRSFKCARLVKCFDLNYT